jgi:hypothetical protein
MSDPDLTPVSVSYPSNADLKGALGLLSTLGNKGKGREILENIKTAMAKNEKLVDLVNLRLAKLADTEQRQSDLAKREELADAAIAKMAAMEAAFNSYQVDLAAGKI